MLEAIIWAKKSHKKFVYLGTCYEPEALYKTEFKGVEFFNGFRWSNNLDELKTLLTQSSDEYLLQREEFLKRFYQGDLQFILNKYGVRVNF